MNTGKKVGYFGGTFDPPHLGHLILAYEACHQLKLDELAWILTPDPPHKTSRQITSVDLRLDMLLLITDNEPMFSISRVDLDREPPHYAADTVQLIRERSPADSIVYLIGEDSLQDLPNWKDPERFLKILDLLAIAPRPGIVTDLPRLEGKLPGLTNKVQYLKGVNLEISSSQIRDRIRSNEPYRHLLPEIISQYLDKTNPYH
jgi:nicotinate-nucleotide adenylyltransferase